MRKIVREFTEEMERVLQRNEGKGGWSPDECSINFLQERLVDEQYEYKRQAKTYQEKADECIDMANFCMMLWSRHLGKVSNKEDCL